MDIVIVGDAMVDGVNADVIGVTTSDMAWEVASVITGRVADGEDHMHVFFLER
jgi:hypothetical protein